jgi:predicted dehydrogenase
MTALRWGILGPGRIAPRLVRAVAGCARGELAAVASRDQERAAAFAAAHGIPRAIGSYDARLAAPDVDGVYLSLPNPHHAEWTIGRWRPASARPLREPLALTVEQVDAIAAAAGRGGRHAVEAFMASITRRPCGPSSSPKWGRSGRLVLVSGPSRSS